MIETYATPTKPLVADKMLSTFWWEMLLDPTRPENVVDKMTGYSAFQGHDEAKDKRQMLMRKILMLYTNNWLAKSTQIIIYRRTGEFVNKQHDELLVALKRDGYDIAPKYLKDIELIKFLNSFYKLIRQGKDVKQLLPPARARFSKDDYLNIDLQNLKIGTDLVKLNNYCARLVRNGHPFDAVQSFFMRYRDKYFR